MFSIKKITILLFIILLSVSCSEIIEKEVIIIKKNPILTLDYSIKELKVEITGTSTDLDGTISKITINWGTITLKYYQKMNFLVLRKSIYI